MKKRTFITCLIISLAPIASSSGIPDVKELTEHHATQRRDLSMIGSRIVLNPYDFNASPVDTPPVKYSNSAALPLNIGYLTTGNNYREQEKRFGREFKEILEIRRKDGKGNFSEAEEYATFWAPHALGFTAVYGNNTAIRGEDFFYDEHTIVRTIKTDTKDAFLISGRIKGEAIFNKKEHVLLVHSLNCKYAVTFKEMTAGNISFYTTKENLLTGKKESSVSSSPSFWSVETGKSGNVDMVVTFGLLTESDESLIERAKRPLRKNNIQQALAAQESFWNTFLQTRIPHPQQFDLPSIDNKGITGEEIRKAYYKAWVLLAQNVLLPESNEFPYYQIVTGKASLWDEGHESAPFSAAWESFVAMQLFGYVDTEISWSCLKGLLSLVDEDGMLGGESLPSRKAHTAWVLYELSGDKTSLEEVYPALERYLNWRIANPRWIYNGMTPENEKDAEFVVSAIMDMEYMVKIAAALSSRKEAAGWENKRQEYINRYKSWFWSHPQHLPVQHLNHYKGRDTHPIQITTGLYIDELDGDFLHSMLGLVYKYYDSNVSFAGFNAPKYPDMDLTIYGLISKNKTELAKGLIESTLRDILLAESVFAETYTNDPVPLPGGVRPSIFGMAEIIDFTLLRNGYMFTRGEPTAINIYPDEETGVKNIFFKGEYYHIQNKGKNRIGINKGKDNTDMGNMLLSPGERKAFFSFDK